MNELALMRREVDVIRKIRSNFGTSEYELTNIVQAFGEDLRTSVSLGFADDAIAWDLYSRWQEMKEEFQDSAA